MRIEKECSFLVCFLLAVAVFLADAAPRFANVFSDHAVLQRDAEILVWGSDANPGQTLSVRIGKLRAIATVEASGRWKARLPSQSAANSGQSLELIEGEEIVATVKDVVVGEVWLAAGQSNMQFPVRGMLKGLPEAQSWVESANRSAIRFRRIDDRVLNDRQAEANDLASAGEWKLMTPDSVLAFSAVAAVFARELQEQLQVPVGIIDVSWGGKPIEPFIPREAFSTPLLGRIRELADADKLEELKQLRGGVIIRNPEGYPGAIFNARMAPVVPYGLCGFLWYQAESNAGRGEDPREYRYKMQALVEGWRARWKNEKLPVYFVQLPSYPPASGWIRMREEQRLALTIPDTAMAVTIDIRGEGIHPPDKLSVGRRLSRLALVQSYGRAELESSGPLYQSHRVVRSNIRVRFTHVKSGLMVGEKPGVLPARETSGAPLRWFEVAGGNKIWHAAEARIDGEEVVVSARQVANPVAVRYACQTQPQGGNLYNRAGLPASPFCSHLEMLPWANQK